MVVLTLCSTWNGIGSCIARYAVRGEVHLKEDEKTDHLCSLNLPDLVAHSGQTALLYWPVLTGRSLCFPYPSPLCVEVVAIVQVATKQGVSKT